VLWLDVRASSIARRPRRAVRRRNGGRTNPPKKPAPWDMYNGWSRPTKTVLVGALFRRVREATRCRAPTRWWMWLNWCRSSFSCRTGFTIRQSKGDDPDAGSDATESLSRHSQGRRPCGGDLLADAGGRSATRRRTPRVRWLRPRQRARCRGVCAAVARQHRLAQSSTPPAAHDEFTSARETGRWSSKIRSFW